MIATRSGKTGRFVGTSSSVQKSPASSVGQKIQVDRWLKSFDAKQAALSSRQDAFLDKLGVKQDGGTGRRRKA